jgi:hypothetical protein
MQLVQAAGDGAFVAAQGFADLLQRLVFFFTQAIDFAIQSVWGNAGQAVAFNAPSASTRMFSITALWPVAAKNYRRWERHKRRWIALVRLTGADCEYAVEAGRQVGLFLFAKPLKDKNDQRAFADYSTLECKQISFGPARFLLAAGTTTT